jgi:chorismate mutase
MQTPETLPTTLIAGPCSAETPEQLYQTIVQIRESMPQIELFRAGIWKPRTRPNTFEGVGQVGLEWLAEVKKELGIKTTIEVATAQHVELALKNDIDVLWIGARSSVNPFTVQEIADALKGTDVPVMIKNPMNPDLTLWIGAIERMRKAGVQDIKAIHRGFAYYGKGKYRNDPIWQIALDFKAHFPDIPLIGDPSHIAGKRELLLELAQKMMDLRYDGLMIETHVNPQQAWSDAEQQLTPADLRSLLQNIHFKKEGFEDEFYQNKLALLREKIDLIDQEIIAYLAKRTEVIREIGTYKTQNSVAIFQPQRWKQIKQTRPHWAENANLEPDFILTLYKLIHDESIRIQTSHPETSEDENAAKQ